MPVDKQHNFSDEIASLGSGAHVIGQGDRITMRLPVAIDPFFLWAGNEQTSKLRYEKLSGKASEMHPESSLVGLGSAFGLQHSPGAVSVEMWLAVERVRLLLSQLRVIGWPVQQAATFRPFLLRSAP
jgi:hypothetical protein